METVVTVNEYENNVMECVQDSGNKRSVDDENQYIIEDNNDKPDTSEIVAEMERKDVISYTAVCIISSVFITILVFMLK
jgi:hypothetical protein